MSERLNYTKASPGGVKAFGRVYNYIMQSGLDDVLVGLVYLRVSQVNGCAYCVGKHTRDLIKRGVKMEKLALVQVWQEAGKLFSDRERAALAWADTVTRVAQTGVPDADFEAASHIFDEKELADLTMAISLMNAYNRLAISFRRTPEAALAAKPHILGLTEQSRDAALRPVPLQYTAPARVLVVDDIADVRDTMCAMLTLLGHAVKTADGAQAALKTIEEFRPDVVFSDIGMPDMDGYELARRIRAAGYSAVLVAVTGYGQPEDIQRARAAGFDEHVVKPPDMHRVRAILRDCRTPRAGDTPTDDR